MSPIPTIVIGKNPDIAKAVREELLPEYDVIHVLTTVEDALKNLPLLLSTPPKAPQNAEHNIGSRNYDKRPAAIVVGGGFNDESFNEIKDACQDFEKGIFWVRPNSMVGSMPSLSSREALGTQIARRVKRTLNELDVGSEKGAKAEDV